MRSIMTLLCVLIIAGTRTLAQEPVPKPFDHSSKPVGGDVWTINKDFCLSPDGKRLVVCGMNGWRNAGWSLWDVKACKKLSTGKVISNAHKVAVSSDGKYVAAGGDADKFAELALFDAISGRHVAQLDGHLHPFGGKLEFTPDSKHLVSLASDNLVRVWIVGNQKPIAKYCFTSTVNPIFHNTWQTRPDGPATKAQVEVVFREPIIWVSSFALSPDGKELAVATLTQEVWLLETLTGKRLERLRCKSIGAASCVAYSPDGSLLAIGGIVDPEFFKAGHEDHTGQIEIWNRKTKEHVSTLGKHIGPVRCLAIGRDNEHVVSGGTYDGVRVWDIKTGKMKYRLYEKIDETNRKNASTENGDPIPAVAFMPDGRTFLTLHQDQDGVCFWDIATGKKIDPTKRK